MRHDEHFVDELVAAGSMPQLRLVAASEIEGATTSTESLVGLVDSIQAYGILQPLLVRRRHGRYELLAGSKRLTAALDAGLKEVPCLVHEVDDVEARRLAEAANRRTSGPQPSSVSEQPLGASASSMLESSLQTIVSTLSLLEQPERPLRDHVAVALIRAEAMKSERLLHGLLLLATDPPLIRRSFDAARILKSVLEHSEDEDRGVCGDIEAEACFRAVHPKAPQAPWERRAPSKRAVSIDVNPILYACWHGALAQVQVLYAVLVETLVAELERGLPRRHLGEMRNELGNVRVLRENQLLGGPNERVMGKCFELHAVALEFLDHPLTSVINYTLLFLIRFEPTQEHPKTTW